MNQPTTDPARQGDAVASSADVPKVLKLADGFYVRQAVDNIAWLDMGDFALAVDALEQPELEDEVFHAIESTIDPKPVRYMLNTHTHYDHVALNAAFVRRHGTQIVSNEGGRIGPDGLWLEGTRRRVLMLPMPGCHTDEDCIVWVPADRVLFVGDIFGWGLIPLVTNLRRESARLLVSTYQRLIDYDAAIVVPGHGPMITTGHLRRWVEYFRWLLERIAAAVAVGKDDTQILAELPPPSDMHDWWRFLLWKHKDSVTKVAKSIRKGWVKPSDI